MERLWLTAIITITITIIVIIITVVVVITGAINTDYLRNISNMKKKKS